MKQYSFSSRAGLGIIALVAATSGCTPPKPVPLEGALLLNGRALTTHRVTYPNETPAIIASWYFGTEDKVPVLTEDNPLLTLSKPPAGLPLGTIVLLRQTDILQNTPLPKDFITAKRAELVRKAAAQTIRRKVTGKKPVTAKTAPKAVSATGAIKTTPSSPSSDVLGTGTLPPTKAVPVTPPQPTPPLNATPSLSPPGGTSQGAPPQGTPPGTVEDQLFKNLLGN